MIKVNINYLRPGMKVGKNVFDKDGKLLLTEGAILKPQYIKKLELYNIGEIFVDADSPYKIEHSVSKVTKNDVIYQEAFSAVKDIMTKVRTGDVLEILDVTTVVEDIVEQVLYNQDAFMQLTFIRDLDNYTFLHSIDVCIYSTIIGKNLGFDEDMLKTLGLGAILHDIGKGKIPPEILLKPGPLSDYEFSIMKQHTTMGYDVLRRNPSLDETIANIALQHHEHWDGNGYPSGLKDYEIELFPRIVTLCDIYDALTADRIYRNRILPHEAAEYILQNKGILTDPNLTKCFIENIALYPLNSTVLLNTGEIGRVISIPRSMPLRPVINVFSHTDSDLKIEPYELDLLKNLTKFIVDIIN